MRRKREAENGGSSVPFSPLLFPPKSWLPQPVPFSTPPFFESPGHYEQWLERQPADVQREIVGPTRYRLFLADRKKPGVKQGGLPLALAVEDGRIIPVARLKAEWANLRSLQERQEAKTCAD